ncbi:MAG: hypothetical protein OEV69_11420 [Gammaproteobacteria bacterium]|nr:hypothetical protein [Gammaproteobacteria bacterium]MDH5322606.1 hypothetical protein [Gammaproteobacteria bacterium]
MKDELKSRIKALQVAKSDFTSAAKRSVTELGKRRDRLVADLKRANKRIARMRVQTADKAARLANASKASALKTRAKVKEELDELRASARAVRAEAHTMRTELRVVREDLAEARHHLSHALHIDRAMAKVEKAMQQRRSRKK